MMNLSDTDAELLSAYLDNLLDEPERIALEARLATEEPLRRELAALRQTVALLNALPPRRAPRNYTLTPDMLRRPPAPPLALAASPPQIAVVPPPTPKKTVVPPRRLWLPASAAATVVVALGFFAVIAATGILNPTPTAIANAPTPLPSPFFNQVITGITESFPIDPTATPIIDPKLGETPTSLFATQDPFSSPYGEDPQQNGGMLGGGDGGFGGMGGSPEIDPLIAANAATTTLLDPDPNRPGFTTVPLDATTEPAQNQALRRRGNFLNFLADLIEWFSAWLRERP
jgi:hypothetical protein